MFQDMRNVPIICLFCLASLLLVGCSGVSQRACSDLPDGGRRAVLVSEKRTGIVLDGALDDWEGIRFQRVTPANGVLDASTIPVYREYDLSFRFAVCHNDDALYVAVEVIDDVINSDSCPDGAISCPAWDDDAVEVFIDGNHNHAEDARANDRADLKFGGEFALVANGAANSDYSGYPKSFGREDTWQGSVKQVQLPGGIPAVRYEFRISWNMMGLNARPDRIGFNISVQDDDDGGRRDHALYFVGNPSRPFVDERYFADLILKD